MRRAAILWLFFLLPLSPNARSQGPSIIFSGEVSEGDTFERNIGHGLKLVLIPSSWGGGITGWTIAVSPQGQPTDPACTDFLWVVTPPYHFQNVRYLDTSYSTTAQEVMRASPREFNFVLNCAELKTESKRVDLVIYPSNASKQEVEEAMAKLGSSPLGKGRLWIKSYRITPGKRADSEVDLGAIHWMKFKVEIKFPPGPSQQPKP